MKRAIICLLALLLLFGAEAEQVSRAHTRALGSSAEVQNAALAADSIYDTMLTEGTIFSFNRLVGAVTESHGFVSALDGSGDMVPGGGADAVASAIWLAVQDMDEVSIMEKSTYGGSYSGSYVSNGSDAILVDYGAGCDFCFRYNGGGTMTLYTWVENGAVYCEVDQSY